MQFVEAHGARIPQIGLGTMTLKGDVCVQAVKTALDLGYRHLDTAAYYENEKENGEGLRASSVKREEVLICTKVRQGDLMPDAFARVVDQSLKNLQLPYVDLLLIHWNNPDIPFKLSVGALCKAKKDGLAKHVGVANFTSTMLDEAWAVTSEPLVCNQIEMHPFINQDKVLAACQEARHGGGRLLPDRARQGARRRRARAHRQGARQDRGAGLLALSGADGRLLDPAHRDAGAFKAEHRGVRFRAVGRRDGRVEETQRHQYARGQPAARAQVGRRLMRAAILVLIILATASTAFGQAKYPAAEHTKDIEDCIKTAAGSGKPMSAAESCIGTVADPCLKEAKSTADRHGCIAREQAVWDDILNETYRRLRGKLDKQTAGQIARHAAGLDRLARQDLRLLLGLLPGHHGEPDERVLRNRKRARRALFLLGFLEDAEGK